MMNHAHVLSKYQVAETIQQSERIDFHSDVLAETIKRSLANNLIVVSMVFFQPASQVLLLMMLLHFLITLLLIICYV